MKLTMRILKFITLLIPILTFGQDQNTKPKSPFNISNFSDSRFEIDSNGFHGIIQADTSYYTDKKIASIGHYAIDRNLRMSGNKFGLWTAYYHNGQIKSHGNYAMCSLLYSLSLKNGVRLEHSYKIGKWIYYYENGQVKAMGTYKNILTKAKTGIDNQFHKSSLTTTDWKFFNLDGSKSKDNDKIIRDIEYDPNCD
jgi:antitoxin component YwqK of YwqJK toxin-antitoxin module